MNIEKDTIKNGDCLELIKELPLESIDLIVTSPPYWGKRIYNYEGELGNEITPFDYINELSEFFESFRPYLKKTANIFINIGDTYFGSRNGAWNKYYNELGESNEQIQKSRKEGHYYAKSTQPKIERDGKLFQNKQLLLIPSRFAIKMQDNGWVLRDDIIWHKNNCKPESVKDRFSNKYEHIFHFVLSEKPYYFDLDSVRIPATTGGAKNPGNVWRTNLQPSLSSKHTAVFPEELVEIMINCGTPMNGVVFDPFMGTGTTGVVAKKLKRTFIGCEINKNYYDLAIKRINEVSCHKDQGAI